MATWTGAISLTSTPDRKGYERPQTYATSQYSRIKQFTNAQHAPSSHQMSSRALSRSLQVRQRRMQGHTSSSNVGCILPSGLSSEGECRYSSDKQRTMKALAFPLCYECPSRLPCR